MAGTPPSEIDPQQLAHAEYLWKNFGTATKWGIGLVVLVLLFLLVATYL